MKQHPGTLIQNIGYSISGHSLPEIGYTALGWTGIVKRTG